MVLLEANAAGTPVIACASGGISEILTDAENGACLETDLSNLDRCLSVADECSSAKCIERAARLSLAGYAGFVKAVRGVADGEFW